MEPAVEGSLTCWSGNQEVRVDKQGQRMRGQKFNQIDVRGFCFWKEGLKRKIESSEISKWWQ